MFGDGKYVDTNLSRQPKVYGMDKEEPKTNDNVIPHKEFFWRKFRMYLQQFLYGQISKQDFVDSMMRLGYTEKEIKTILGLEGKDEDD